MPIETLDLMVDAGNAKPGPATAQKLGPMGVNIAEVMNKVNQKTAAFKGMQVPVKLKIDTKSKQVTEIEVGTPPTTQLIKKEFDLEKGSGQPNKQKVGDMSIEQCIKVAKMKQDSMFSLSLKKAVKTVVGSCGSLGILVEGKKAVEAEKEIDEGKYDELIKQEKTEISDDKKKFLQEQLKQVQAELTRELEKAKALEEAAKEVKKEEKVEVEKKEETPPKEAVKEATKEVKKESKKEEKKKKE